MQNIGVFFGSRNTEHDISIMTAEFVIYVLKGLGYEVTPVYLGKKGEWMIGQELGDLKNFIDPTKKIEVEKFGSYVLDLEQSRGKMAFRRKGFSGKTITVDMAFPALHGAYGEDGTLQGMFEMFNIPYVGCDVTASALAMDKALTKQMCQVHGIPTTKFIYFYKNEWEHNKQAILDKIKGLKWPVFVKPVHLGSSIGIAKIKENDFKSLEEKIEVALFYDDKVLVEECVSNLMDVTCCVIGNEDLTTSVLQESVFQADFFDFEEKYIIEGGAQLGKSESGLVIPARLDEETTRKIQDMAKEVYRALDCAGIARIDFLFNKETKEVFANEVNPLPGTLYHHLWKESGLEIEGVVQKLINLAQDRYNRKQVLTLTFESNALSNLNSTKMGKGSKIRP